MFVRSQNNSIRKPWLIWNPRFVSSQRIVKIHFYFHHFTLCFAERNIEIISNKTRERYMAQVINRNVLMMCFGKHLYESSSQQANDLNVFLNIWIRTTRRSLKHFWKDFLYLLSWLKYLIWRLLVAGNFPLPGEKSLGRQLAEIVGKSDQDAIDTFYRFQIECFLCGISKMQVSSAIKVMHFHLLSTARQGSLKQFPPNLKIKRKLQQFKSNNIRLFISDLR